MTGIVYVLGQRSWPDKLWFHGLCGIKA